MKKITPLFVASLLLLSACGQKGPLILEERVTKPASVSASSSPTQTDEKADVEVLQDEPVLNVQTDDASTAR